MMMTSYKDLQVWQEAMDLTSLLYETVKKLPKNETYALSDQMRRVAVSIPSNIAEGYGRNSSKSYAHFLSVARGSAYEFETRFLLCPRTHHLSSDDIHPLIDIISELVKMLTSLINKLCPPKPKN